MRALQLRRKHWQQMHAHVSACAALTPPEEACGMLAGQYARSQAVYPITNVLHSAHAFRMQPDEQVKAYFNLLDCGWDLLALYHSHPWGKLEPSSTDLENFLYPESLLLIWAIDGPGWSCMAYTIRDGQANNIPIRLVAG